jgi:hypothetical protein
MKESLWAAIGIWLVFVLVFASLVGAQTGQVPVPAEDGTRLMIPGSVTVNPAALKAGATVKASIEEKGGQKVVTAIQVN